nr:phosphotransferase [uncultured Dongia sp.]
MTRDHFEELPTEHRVTAGLALATAFGATPIEAITPVMGGASGAWTFRVDLSRRHYLLRIEGAASPLRNPHQYRSLQIAAQAGIAPRCHYVDESARIAILDFVEERPLDSFPGGPLALARALGEMVRRVQATPLFPEFIAYPDMVGRLWAWVCQTGLFAPGVLDPCTERFSRIREICTWESTDLVSSHNDPLPRNILFDGTRLWMIDWESAYRNDPLVDVAIMLDNFAPEPALESAFLHAWLGHSTSDGFYEKLNPVRSLTRLYYAGVLLSASAAAGRETTDTNLTAPTRAEFEQAVGAGHLKPGATETKHILGKMFLNSFLSGDMPPGFSAAV